MGFNPSWVWVGIVLSLLLVGGCDFADRRIKSDCEKLEATWGSQMAKRKELLKDLGITPGTEATILYRIKQHSKVHKEGYNKACMHVINKFQH